MNLTVKTHSSFYMGVDLGQSKDYTAIAITEHLQRSAEDDDCGREHEFKLRHCKRLPLGTSYQDITKHIKGIVKQFEREGKGITLLVDATGVGRPVIDLLRDEGLKPVPIVVTSGFNANYDSAVWHVPKRDLVSAAKVMLGRKELKIAKGMPFADILVNELETFHIKVNLVTGHDTYGAWREGEHDDLVFALSLTCWWGLRKKRALQLFDGIDEIIGDTSEGAILPDTDYRIGWVPALNEEFGALVIYNVDSGAVILLQRTTREPIQQQIDAVFRAAQRYDAVVRGQAEIDEAVLNVLTQRGAYVKRVDVSPLKFSQAYENLSLLISYRQIKLPDDPELLVELEERHNSTVMALCLVTYDIYPDLDEGLEDPYAEEKYEASRGPLNFYDEYDDDTFGY